MIARITLQDMRSLKYCAKGSRQFFTRHNLDWSRFVSDGIPVDEIAHIEDGMLRRLIEKAKQREASHG
jgi:hypothetical protein